MGKVIFASIVEGSSCTDPIRLQVKLNEKEAWITPLWFLFVFR